MALNEARNGHPQTNNTRMSFGQNADLSHDDFRLNEPVRLTGVRAAVPLLIGMYLLALGLLVGLGMSSPSDSYYWVGILFTAAISALHLVTLLVVIYRVKRSLTPAKARLVLLIANIAIASSTVAVLICIAVVAPGNLFTLFIIVAYSVFETQLSLLMGWSFRIQLKPYVKSFSE
jgi:hypothetical protein